jgi:hypothetical protein
MWLVALAGLTGLAAVADLVRNGAFMAWINHVGMSQGSLICEHSLGAMTSM